MAELEVVEQDEEQVEALETSYYPSVPNLVWDFAHGIIHSVCIGALHLLNIVLKSFTDAHMAQDRSGRRRM